jgi:hypothetical protein
MATKQQRRFDIAEYKAKVISALKQLEQNQQPGEQTGTGSKTEVLEQAKSEIFEMMKKGYTAKQIADAMKDDVFAILPKTITELTGSKAVKKQTTDKAKKAVPAANKPATVAVTNTEQINQPARRVPARRTSTKLFIKSLLP